MSLLSQHGVEKYSKGIFRTDWDSSVSKSNKIDNTVIKWSRPMSIEELSKIFNVHRNTMSKWLRDQVICNRQLSPRRWQVAKYEFFNGLTEKKVSDII